MTLLSCNNSSQTKETLDADIVKSSIDTVLVHIENKINKSYGIGFYSKSYTYCWVVDKDTLDFKIGLTEYVSDSSVQLRVFHRKPVLFSRVIDKINDCLPLIQQDFNLENLSSLYFESPIFYKDLTTELSKSYISQFGHKNIKHVQQNDFLISSWLNKKVSVFLKQIDKTTRRYGIEKFHLLDKEYYNEYFPNFDFNDYPEFSIHGMGISVILNDEEK